MASIEREALLRVGESERLHWLDTDGLGGGASGTAPGIATLRSHGLLSGIPPGGTRRHLYLSRFEESISEDGRELPLSTARYPGSLHPSGHRFLDAFTAEPHPTTSWRLGNVTVRRELLVTPSGAVLLRYAVDGPAAARVLSLRGFFPCRDADGLTRENVFLDGRATLLTGGFAFWPYPSLPRVCVTTGGATVSFERDPQWYRNVEYTADAEGTSREDVFTPGVLRVALGSGEFVVVAASTGTAVVDPVVAWEAETARRAGDSSAASARGEKAQPTEVSLALGRAARHFVFRTPDGRSGVRVGWPGPGESTVDAMIALPGLTLPRGEVEFCGAVLERAAATLDGGRLPERLDGAEDETQPLSVEAALWWGRAVILHGEERKASRAVRDRLDAALLRVAADLHDGTTPHRIRDESGLLIFQVGGRSTCPVVPNALWILLLEGAARAARHRGAVEDAATWSRRGRAAGKAFLRRLWVKDEGRLADHWADDAPSATTGAGAVVAASLEVSPLSRAQRAAVAARARSELVTSRGLRVVSPRDGTDGGSGAVRADLLGFYVEATLRAKGRGAAVRADLQALLDGFAPHLREHGLGLVSAFFDGNPPHEPGGAFAHGPSTGEVLRAYRLLGIPSG
jgi:glycogen debranching enzyme